MQKDAIVNRIIEIGNDNNYSISALEKECEMTRGILNQAYKRGSSISTYNFGLFVKKLPVIAKGRRVNYDYLLLGQLPKYENAYKAEDQKHYAKEVSVQDRFEERLELALDNEDIQKKLKEVLLLSQ